MESAKYGGLSVMLSLVGCLGFPNPLPSPIAETEGSSGSTSLGMTGQDSGTGGSTGSGSTTSDDPCSVRCGEAAECCAADGACIDGQCVPSCASGVWCGAGPTCCRADELCLAGVCTPSTGACIDSLDCETAEFCEPTLDQCFPQPRPLDCSIQPGFIDIEAEEEWSFQAEQVISMPAVADIDGDQLPEVVINTYFATDPGGPSVEFFGEVVVLDGASGNEQFRVQNDPPGGSYGSYSRSTVGLADVDGNDLPDVIYSGRPQVGISPFPNNASLVHAVNGLGQHLWSSHAPDGSDYFIYIRHGGPAFANFDADDESEIVYGTAVLDHDGTVVFDQDNEFLLGGGVFGSNGNYLGGLSATADLTGDGYPEIISGRQAWSVDWEQPPVGPPNVTLNLLWESTAPDGFPAVVDLDLDGSPEVVLVGDPVPHSEPEGVITILEGFSGDLWCGADPTGAACLGNASLRTQPLSIVAGGRGGPPVIADFDGDGRPEIGVAGGSEYAVYDLNRPGESVVQPVGDPPPEPGAIYVRWSNAIEDEGSNNTGSSAFDFQGDGAAEVIYGDECTLRVYDGQTGSVIHQQDSSSGTIHEYAVVADVDADGESEMLVVANDQNADTACGSMPGYVARRGVFAYGASGQRWARTRQVWTSHTYHVTNATARGLTPVAEVDSWAEPETNQYRANVVDRVSPHAPDLRADIATLSDGCPGQLSLSTIVRNTGTIGVAEGVEVTLFRGPGPEGELIDVQVTDRALAPGESVVLDWDVSAPDEPTQFSVTVDSPDAVAECDETNNSSTSALVSCEG